MPRPTKPMKRRNTKRRPPSLAIAQREAVIARSSGYCEFEKRQFKCSENLVGSEWGRCFAPATDTAHILRRHLCTGGSVYDADVALYACRSCHALYDSRLGTERVRPPEAAVARAVAAVKRAEAARAAAGKAVVKLKGHPNV